MLLLSSDLSHKTPIQTGNDAITPCLLPIHRTSTRHPSFSNVHHNVKLKSFFSLEDHQGCYSRPSSPHGRFKNRLSIILVGKKRSSSHSTMPPPLPPVRNQSHSAIPRRCFTSYVVLKIFLRPVPESAPWAAPRENGRRSRSPSPDRNSY